MMKNDYVINGDETTILINSKTHGKQKTIIDTEDLEKVKKVTWGVQWSKFTKSYYVAGNKKIDGKWYSIRMHRYILGLKKGKMQVDHIYHDTLDNRKKNLRIVTSKENRQNKRKQSNNTSGVTGVNWCINSKKWIVQISVYGKRKQLGYYDCFNEAVKVRKHAERKYFTYRNSIKNHNQVAR